MDLVTNNYSDLRYRLSRANQKNNVTNNKTPLIKNDNVSFTGKQADRIIKVTLDKANKIISYTNANELVENIDNILGEKTFSKALKKANINIIDDSIKIKNRTFLSDSFATIKYPFLDLPRDLMISGLNLLKKTPAKDFAQNVLDSKVLKNRIDAKNYEKNRNYVLDILDDFAPLKRKSAEGQHNFEARKKLFEDKVTSNIQNVAKNYDTRDERTLNRMVTSTVSAVYSGNDFYNISMLQKDDKNEAKKAEKSRRKQELTRMALSAGTTFVTLGVLNRYVRGHIILNAIVIGLSALISEVISRIISKTPLLPLTPEQARKKALEQGKIKEKEPEKTKDSQLAFKNNLLTTKTFKQFASQDGTFTSLKTLTEQTAKEAQQKKKKISIKKALITASSVVSLLYFAKKGLNGDLKLAVEKNKLFKDIKLKDLEKYTFGEIEIDQKTKDEIKTIKKLIADRKGKPTFYDKTAKFLENAKSKILLTKNEKFNIQDLVKTIEDLKTTAAGKEHADLLDAYIKHAQDFSEKISSELTSSRKNDVVNGFYSGVTKIFKTIYTILSVPAMVVDGVAFGRNKKIYETLSDKLQENNAEKYKKEIQKLWNILPKANEGKSKEEIENIAKDTVNKILKNARNFEKGSETGELANISRTMVTAISTFFFVNDYTNRVLIESGGKATQEAKEERSERIAHKFANFIINGTLMNTFNSIFKKQLNNSLIQAAAIAGLTEATNEFLVRKSICQPIGKKASKQDIIDYETKQINNKGPLGAWSRLFKKITGKKSLTQKAGIEIKTENKTK